VPQIGLVVERLLAPLGRRRGGDLGGGFLLGCALGFAFVPCGGPILAYVTAQSASLSFGFNPVALAIAYALGASLVLLAIAIGGQRIARPLRARVQQLRPVLGVVVAAAAFALVFNLDTRLQTSLPNWTNFLQEHTENTAFARNKLYEPARKPERTVEGLPDYGPAPEFITGGRWFNSAPLTLRGLRGKVVLVDFWTYSCINCLRTLPHVEAWDARYRSQGLVIVGVHTPEFAFEHKASNVGAAIERLGVRYPVVQDNDFATWNAYSNQYWPAKYLIDKSGHVRYAHFGEGAYAHTEKLIRRLLGVSAAPMTDVPDETPTGLLTPETYLGTARIANLVGDPVHAGTPWTYRLPKVLHQNELAFGGRWTLERERAVAGENARLRIDFQASKVFLVLGGHGTVDVLVDGRRVRTVRVDGDRLYTLVDSPRRLHALLELRVAPNVSAYAFTFG
jgi:thiol-disulfide isomerase/thioredoxin